LATITIPKQTLSTYANTFNNVKETIEQATDINVKLSIERLLPNKELYSGTG
jgi:hypothetical protein